MSHQDNINIQNNLPQGMSITGMVIGIVSFILCITPASIVGLPISFIAYKKCKKGEAGGEGMALAGIILNGIHFVVWAIGFFLTFGLAFLKWIYVMVIMASINF